MSQIIYLNLARIYNFLRGGYFQKYSAKPKLIDCRIWRKRLDGSYIRPYLNLWYFWKPQIIVRQDILNLTDGTDFYAEIIYEFRGRIYRKQIEPHGHPREVLFPLTGFYIVEGLTLPGRFFSVEANGEQISDLINSYYGPENNHDADLTKIPYFEPPGETINLTINFNSTSVQFISR